MSLKIIPVIDPKICQQITRKLVHEAGNSRYFFHDGQVPKALTIKEGMFPAITRIYQQTKPPTDLDLIHTNWYGRMYVRGNELLRHYDGDHCDHSLTITIGYSDENWPIFIDGVAYDIPIGHGAYYRGCQMEHWREPLQYDWHIQLFFHYKESK